MTIEEMKKIVEERGICESCNEIDFEKFNHDLVELLDNSIWYRTSEKLPEYSGYYIIADGRPNSLSAYYLTGTKNWFTNHKCNEEIIVPVMWREMPDVPKESLITEGVM